MKRLTITLFLLLTIISQAQDGNSGIIYGDDHAFALTAPNGWILDNSAGERQGLHAVFYPKESSWEQSVAVMYANTADLEVYENKSIKELVDYDVNNFKKNHPNLEVKVEEAIIINDKTKALVRYLSGDSHGNYEAIAYIEAPKNIGIMIILSSRTKKAFDNSLVAFEQLVKSYQWITSDVNINKKGK
jgi:L-asparaginase/Glu-tRNA(Gln) amidotransferase subunit D